MRTTDQTLKTVSAIAVIDLANELVDRRCISPSVLNNMGRDFEACYIAWKNNQTIHDKRLPEELLIKLWCMADTQDQDNFIGLNIGQKINHSAKGLLANWVFQCQTLGESFSTFSENIHLLNPSERWEKCDEGDNVRLLLNFDSNAYPSIAIDRSMSTIISWSSALAGKKVCPIRATFARSKPNNIDSYIEIFGNKLIFDHDENSLVFSKDVFQQENQMGNPYLKELLESQALELGSIIDSLQSIIGAVRRLLHLDLVRFCQIDAVCDQIHLSRSTLYRKLKAENTSFTELVKEARIRKAKLLEEKKASQSVIADELGFKDVGSFYRFRKSLNE